jgi:hypothetical protein
VSAQQISVLLLVKSEIKDATKFCRSPASSAGLVAVSTILTL